MADVVDSYVVDQFSPHDTKVLRVRWDRTMFPANITSNRVDLIYVPAFNRGNFNLLSFRIGQAVSTAPDSYDVKVWINDKTVLLSTVADLIPPPIRVSVDLLLGSVVDATKTIMKTYAIQLSAFGSIGSTINTIKFDFGVNPASPTAKSTFFIDSIQLWRIV